MWSHTVCRIMWATAFFPPLNVASFPLEVKRWHMNCMKTYKSFHFFSNHSNDDSSHVFKRWGIIHQSPSKSTPCMPSAEKYRLVSAMMSLNHFLAYSKFSRTATKWIRTKKKGNQKMKIRRWWFLMFPHVNAKLLTVEAYDSREYASPWQVRVFTPQFKKGLIPILYSL